MAVDKLAKKLVVLDPTAEPEAVEASIAPRLPSLDGKVLGILDNAKPNSDRILDMVAKLLGNKYKLAAIVKRRKHSPSRGVPTELIDELSKECHFVVTGVGD
jgi:hypothetical protein